MADKKKPKQKPVTTAPGVASFCYIDKPDTKFKDAGEFKTNLVLSGEAAKPFMKIADDLMAKLKEDDDGKLAELEKARKDWNKNPKNKKKQIEELQENLPYAPEYDEETGDETGNIIFKFSSAASGKFKSGPKTGQTWTRSGIDIFDSKGKLLNPENKAKKRPSFPVWSGSTIRVAFTSSPWVGTVTSGYGVKFYLEAVKVLELVTGGGRNADGYGFGEEEDGYEGDEATETADETGDDAGNEEGDEGAEATDF